jgi:hypothetical protein
MMPPARADGGAEKKTNFWCVDGVPLKTPPSRRARADGEERGGVTTGKAREEIVMVSRMAVRRDIAGAEVRAHCRQDKVEREEKGKRNKRGRKMQEEKRKMKKKRILWIFYFFSN